MKIGLIDVDSSTKFPNIPLMKLSAWHKENGDTVEWYDNLWGVNDKVYMSKVFSYTPDYQYYVNAKEIIKGGTGYCIDTVNGKEHFCEKKNTNLPYEIEHMYPDYNLYPNLTKDTAYGFLTRGCPRGCDFCIVAGKEGKKSVKVADLSEFWNGQKNIILCDPNILACKDWKELLTELRDIKANIDFNQGLDIRLMTEGKAELISQVKIKEIHFAWDRYEDKNIILPRLKMFSEICKMKPHTHSAIVYTIVNFNTTIEQDLDRIYTLREMGYWPYVMIYQKATAPKIYSRLARWVNNRFVFAQVERFEDYGKKKDQQTNNLYSEIN